MDKCFICRETKVGHVKRSNGRFYCLQCAQFERYWDDKNLGKCSNCGKVKRSLIKKTSLCRSCYYKSLPKSVCDNCREQGICSFYKKTGKKVCSKCRQAFRLKDTSTFKWCNFCNELKPVATYTLDGFAVCGKCYRKHGRDS